MYIILLYLYYNMHFSFSSDRIRSAEELQHDFGLLVLRGENNARTMRPDHGAYQSSDKLSQKRTEG